MRRIHSWVLGIVLIFAIEAQAHQGHHHSHVPAIKPTESAEQTASQAAELQMVQQQYRENVEPIFRNKCFDCHGPQTRFPWYQNIPGIKQWMAQDMKEAKEHLDFAVGYPFQSHATPAEDLDAIDESIEKNEMPPRAYRWMHPETELTKEEKQKVHQWVELARKQISEK